MNKTVEKRYLILELALSNSPGGWGKGYSHCLVLNREGLGTSL